MLYTASCIFRPIGAGHQGYLQRVGFPNRTCLGCVLVYKNKFKRIAVYDVAIASL